MSVVTTAPKILNSFRVSAACSKGFAVKAGADKSRVTKATAGTDKIIGILQNVTTDTDEEAEVALPGGGAIAKIADTVAFGDELTAGATGALVKVTAANHIVIAVAMEAGVTGDLIGVHVVRHKSTEAQA